MRRFIGPSALAALTCCGARSDVTNYGYTSPDSGVVVVDASVPTSGSYVLSVQPTSITVTQGGVAIALAIHVARSGSFVDEVDVDIPGLPSGVTATSAVLMPGVTDVTITMQASKAAKQGDVPSISVRAITVAAGQQLVALKLFVRGCPGCLDTTFAAQGFASLSGRWPNTIAIDSSDRIVLGVRGPADVETLVRFAPDGALDSAFGGSLSVWGEFSSTILIGADGAFTLAGGTTVAALAHFTASGQPDATFGNGGIVSFPSNYECAVQAVSLATNGDLVALNSCDDPSALITTAFSKLVGISSNGAIDTTFANGGQASFPWTAIDAAGAFLIRTHDGHFVVAGEQIYPNTTSSLDLARFNDDGSLDLTFGNNGQVVSNVAITQTSLIETHDGGLVVCGGIGDSTFAKFGADGALDPKFGNAGILGINPLPASTTAPYGVPNTAAYGIAEQLDGKLVALGIGFTQIFYPQDVSYLVRLNADGTYDKTFASDGVIDMNFGAAYTEVPVGPALQSDGRIVVAGGYGDSNQPTSSTTFIARYWR